MTPEPGHIDITHKTTVPPEPSSATGQVADAVVGGAARASSLADRVRRRRQQILDANTHDFPVPGWEGDLVARVKVIEDREAWLSTSKAKDTDAAFLARATEQLLLRDEDGVLEPLADDAGPIAFDSRFAKLLDIDAPNASGVVWETLGRNPARVSAFASLVVDWMVGIEEDASAEVRPT